MEIRSDRRYRLGSDRETVWRAISDVGAYQRWWPWLRSFDGQALAAGEAWDCLVRPPFAYSVRITVSLVAVDAPRLVSATVAGDVTGTASCFLESEGDICVARMVSCLAPSTLILRSMALLARPLARLGHDWVLDAGARQFTAGAL